MAFNLSEYVGLTSQKISAWLDTVTSRLVQRIAITDGASNEDVGSEVLGPGRGLYVINLAKQESQGVYAVGDDISGAGVMPLHLGAYASTSLTNPTPQTDGRMQALRVTADGRLLSLPYHNPEDTVSGAASNTDGTSTEVLAAQGASTRAYLTWVHLVNLHASTGCYVEIRDMNGGAGTVRDTIYVGASSSKEITYPTPLRGTADTAWNFDPSAAVATIICTVSGYKSKV